MGRGVFVDLGHAELSQYSKVCSGMEFFEMHVEIFFLSLNFCLMSSFTRRALLAFAHRADRDGVDKNGADAGEAMG